MTTSDGGLSLPSEFMQFRIGCALWSHDGWAGHFYPSAADPEDYLDLYVERMTAVEGNTTFHAIPTPERSRGWADRMPEHFRFCPKLHRSISHEGPLQEKHREASEFIDAVKPFEQNLGPFHLQLPPSYGPERFDDLRRFLSAWPRDRGPIGVEVRHEGWFDDDVQTRFSEMLGDLGVARVVLDSRPIHGAELGPSVQSERDKPALPLVADRTASFAVIRYIGHPDVRRNERYLEAWANRIDVWLEEGADVYFFAHCPLERKSPRIARKFHGMLRERNAAVPELPWNRLDRAEGQETLF